MAATSDLVAVEVLGWKADKESKSVQVGFRYADGQEAAWALPANFVDETIAQLVRAKGAIEPPKGIGIEREFAMKVSGVNYGSTVGANDVFLRFNFAAGGQLGFSLDKRLASDLAAGLAAKASRVRITHLIRD